MRRFPRRAAARRCSNAGACVLLLAALTITIGAAACSLSSVSTSTTTNRPPSRRRDVPQRLPSRQRLLSRAQPSRAQRSLLKLAATGSAAAADASVGIVLESSQLKVLLQLNAAWGIWPNNSNATTACSAWEGVTCSPKGLLTALDSKLIRPNWEFYSYSIPASITGLSTLQLLDLTNVNLFGPLPSLASLTGLTHLAIFMDGDISHAGTLDGLAWLSSLTNLQTLSLEYLAFLTGELSSLHFLSHLRSLRQLKVRSLRNATGELPRELQYMTALTSLDLPDLRFVEFPIWITRLTNLQYLNLEADYPHRQGRLLNDDLSQLTALTFLSLSGNNLEGYLPNSWANLAHLQELDLGGNNFEGTIPAIFSALTGLTKIDLSYNQLSGTIPAFATSLQSIFLHSNALSGPIPPHLPALPNLSELLLSDNQFTGAIPSNFNRLTWMTSLNISFSKLSSGLDVVAQMTWLNDISINDNNFSGVLPASFSAISNLFYLNAGNNHFTGTFPDFILRRKGLPYLNLGNNRFTGTIPRELTEFVDLGHIMLNSNNFHGTFPWGLLELPGLSWLDVSNNSLSGELPRTLRVPTFLNMLNLGGNDFTGSLPDFSRWNISCDEINLSGNNFTGSIPDSISTLTTLDGIFLNNNQLTGTIPSAIFTMKKLAYIYLANNHLTGSLPAAISQLKNLEQIWLDNNKIEGPLPAGICSLPWLWRLFISNNSLYGPLPDCLFDKCITQIDVSGNSLYGRINRDFKNMVTTMGAPARDFEYIAADDSPIVNLAHNFFFGDGVLFALGCKVCPTEINEPNNLGIRDSFAWRELGGKCNFLAPNMLARVSLSGNCLTLTLNNQCSSNATQRSTAACQAFCSITDNGPCDGHGACVPADPASPSNFTCLCDAGYTTVDSGNGSSTCAIVHSTTNTTTVSSLSTDAIVGIVLGSFAGFTLLASVVAWLLWPRGQKKWEGLDVCEQFSLQQMLTATNNWSEENVLGKGGFGIVYKGRSPQGQLWAIKRSTIMTNDFETEVRAMASLHHTHLVRLLGFCLDQNVETGKQEQILVYEFMANRDLEYHIHRTKRPLSLRQRLRLAQGAAEGLAYLHGFDTPIVHRDIKPANILVSADMQAKVADFGLLKRLTHGDADATRVAGTPGYVDPDYNRTNVITVKSDVFSFGIVLLQLLSGKSPHVDPKTHIRKWAMKLVETYEVEELRDSKMPAVSEEAIVDFADLALDCIKSPGTRRPTMKDVAYRLSALIDKHCPDEEDEWENVVTEEGTSNQGMPSELCGDGGREPERSHGSQSGVISFTGTFSMTDSLKSWLQLKPFIGR